MTSTAVYQKVTDRIVSMLETGTRPWKQSWVGGPGGGRPLRSNGQPYRGINVLNLWIAASSRGFSSAYWMTYKGAQELGGQVRKGAKSEFAFYAGSYEREVEHDDGETETKHGSFLKTYCVFNADEIDGLPDRFYAKPEIVQNPECRVPHVDAFLSATGATILHGGSRAFYRSRTDEIHLPHFEQFEDAAAYYGTALHELVHWTGSESRLNRTKGLFGNPDYAFEELVAELGACYLAADLEVEAEPREDHASYIADWLKALKDDNRAIFRAASFAERACSFLEELQQPLAEAAD